MLGGGAAEFLHEVRSGGLDGPPRRAEPERALYGRYVIPRRMLDEGCTFNYPEFAYALGDLTPG